MELMVPRSGHIKNYRLSNDPLDQVPADEVLHVLQGIHWLVPLGFSTLTALGVAHL